MIEVIFAVAGCSFAGGYLVQYSTLVEDWRAGWSARELQAWRDFTGHQGRIRRVPSLIRGKFYNAITCGTCFGWHAAWFALAAQAVIAWAAGVDGLVTAPQAPLVWGAACGIHTGLFKTAAKAGLFEE